jgi:hypothetical protein
MKHKRLVIGSMVAGIILIFIILNLLPENNVLRVPMGIEHAVTVTYGGPQLEIKPFKQGVSVNLRIARMVEKNGIRVYDIRYILNDEGEFNLIDFLQSANDESIDDLPAFNVVGISEGALTQDERIQDTEEISVDIKHHYYEYLVLIVLFWLVWLLVLIFYKRPRKAQNMVIETEKKPFAEVLQPYINYLRDGTLNVLGRTELEQLMFYYWKERLNLSGTDMYYIIREIEAATGIGTSYDMLENWLHNPHTKIKDADIVEMLSDYCEAGDIGEGDKR